MVSSEGLDLAVHAGGVKKLKDVEDGTLYRLRVGKHRAIYVAVSCAAKSESCSSRTAN